MKEKIILNKKNSIIFSIIVPIIFAFIYLLIFKLVPQDIPFITENMGKHFMKTMFILSGFLSMIFSFVTFWGTEFFCEDRYKKSEIVLNIRTVKIVSFLIPLIIGIILIIFFKLLPVNPANDLLFIKYMKRSIYIALITSIINSILLFWITIQLSKEKGKRNEN